MQKQKNNATKETRIKSSFWGDAWRRLKQDRAAVVALCVLVLLILCGIFASYIAPYPYDLQDTTATFQLPNAQHLLGTDNFGRDILDLLTKSRNSPRGML